MNRAFEKELSRALAAEPDTAVPETLLRRCRAEHIVKQRSGWRDLLHCQFKLLGWKVWALEAMAAGISGFSGVVCPIQDARAGQVYGAAFSAGENRPNRLMADTPMKVEDYVAEISRFGDRFLFLGDGMPVHRQKLQTLLGDAATFAQPHQAFLRPAAVAYLASLETETVDYLTLMPLYLRAPNAALNKKLTEGLHA